MLLTYNHCTIVCTNFQNQQLQANLCKLNKRYRYVRREMDKATKQLEVGHPSRCQTPNWPQQPDCQWYSRRSSD